MIGSFTLVSWGTLVFSGTLGCIIKETLVTRPGFLQIFGGFSCHGCYSVWLVPLVGVREIGGHKEGRCEVQAWILSIFCWFRGPVLRVFWILLDQKTRFFHIYFQGTFSDDFWVWIWVSGSVKTSIQLSQKLDFLWFQGPFFMILGGLGINFNGFWCFGGWLGIRCIFMVALGHHQISGPFWWVVTRRFLALDSKTIEPETWASDPLDTWPSDTMDS